MTAGTQASSRSAMLAQALSAWMDGEALPEGVQEHELLAWATAEEGGRPAWQHWHLAADVLRQSHADEAVTTALPVETAAWMAGLRQALGQTRVGNMDEDVLDGALPPFRGVPTVQEAPASGAGGWESGVSREEPELVLRSRAAQPTPARLPAAQTQGMSQHPARFDTQRPAANEGLWRWKFAAGFASMAAVALLGWNMLSLQPQTDRMALLVRPTPTAGHAQPQGAAVALPSAQGAATDAAPVQEQQLDELLAAHVQMGGQELLPELTLASLDTR